MRNETIGSKESKITGEKISELTLRVEMWYIHIEDLIPADKAMVKAYINSEHS